MTLFELESNIPLEPQPLTLFLCRQSEPAVTRRKFIAACGTKIIVEVGARGGVRFFQDKTGCLNGSNCLQCKDRRNKIRELIASGK